MKSFRSLLRKKLDVGPSRKFKNEFWEKFETEFARETERKPIFGFVTEMQLWLASGGLAAAGLMLALSKLGTVLSPNGPEKFETNEIAMNTSYDVITQAELVQDYELFDLQNEEWEILAENIHEET